MATSTKPLYLYKEILSLLRTIKRQSNNVSGYQDTYSYCYINQLYRNGSYFCKDESRVEHLQYVAETYLCLLKSIRAAKVLYDRYKGGEDSVEKIATKVGFKLPPTINED